MKQFRVVLTGCGSMSKKWVEYVLSREDTQIVGLVDIIPQNANAMASNYNLHVGVYENLEHAIKEAEANLVFDVTIPDSHKDVVTTALKHGCDVFGEKPMASSLEDAKLILQSVKETGKRYSVMQNRRYNAQIRALKHLTSSDSIGKIGFVNADFFLGPHFGGFRELMDSPLILDMAIHTFDQARFILGENPVSVYCHEFNPEGSWYKGNASAVCIFEFESGAVFCYRGSWCAEGAPTSWESSWRIIGSKGTAIWDGEHAPYCEITNNTQEQKFFNDYHRIDSEVTWSGYEGHWGCLDEMFQALIEGREAETDSADNIRTVAMVFAALESAREGKKISINL